MCCEINSRYGRKFLKELREKGRMTAYRVQSRRGKKSLSSIYKSYVAGSTIRKHGWIRSNRRGASITNGEFATQEILLGRHVYLSKRMAHRRSNGRLVVPVTCYAKDLVGVGRFEYLMGTFCATAVFTKFYMRKKDFEQAIAS